MLETRNLFKVYKPKKGVPVVALNSVSLKFPERGMVFLLGKSGSGKSTLLNLLGGLDKYDDGEIIIKGVSSRDFTQERFDSYRNTYVGFIFQDYNILEEFTVGANIALALELQGKKATDAEINRILEEVDLVGYGNRKPNELSGGQLQRVAIARALVKNPQIIMADEPTGALDSATGKQVFDTLKKLSSEKLVIIVSHDREYAEFYADRIIELSDGKVISDVEHSPEEDNESTSLSFSGDTVTIPQGYHLTEEDRAEINAYIDRIKSGTRLHFSGLTKRFHDTDTSKIPEQDPSKFALIKSRLPMRSAFRIGGSGLKFKKFRLFMTIMLSVVAFTLFGLTDTFSSYNHIRTCTTSIYESDISYLSLIKARKVTYSDIDFYWSTYGLKISDDEIADISKNTGVTVKGVFVPMNMDLSFGGYVSDDSKLYGEGEYYTNIYSKYLTGFVEVTDSDLSALGYKLTAGRLPDGTKNEIAISDYIAETFIHGGFFSGQFNESTAQPIFDKISSANDLIGRKLTFSDTEYEITGVIDTGFDLSRYKSLTEDATADSNADTLVKFILTNELRDAQKYSFNSVAFVGAGRVTAIMAEQPPEVSLDFISLNFSSDTEEYNYNIYPSYIGRLSDITENIIWADGKPRTELADNEIIISSSICWYYNYNENNYRDDILKADQFDDVFAASFHGWLYSYYNSFNEDLSDIRVVGIVDYTESEEFMTGAGTLYVSESYYNKLTEGFSGTYEFAVGPMPSQRSEIEDIVRYCYNESDDIRFQMQNPITYELDSVNDILIVLSRVFIWVGVGFAVFAAIMLANFIGTSIAYKKQEIGILRAIGSRSSDVFNIFFAEGFIIAMINFVVSSIATFTVTGVINYYIRTRGGILITILSFGPRQLALVLLISVGVSLILFFQGSSQRRVCCGL